MTKTAEVTWKGNMHFTGSADTGFGLTLDAAPEVGGQDMGFRPPELILMGLAGCTAMDVISILRKKRQDVTGFEVRVSGDQADDFPMVFTDIHITYVVRGHGVDPAAVERSIELSETKYCMATAMLRQVADITSSYEVVEAKAEEIEEAA
jgi:putative redox protein